jgi:ABC-type nitrate/sulfonate/bicarbonate transport system substrate-binding protein/outer membrane protein OmpA-like peptidoglycan-associated protein
MKKFVSILCILGIIGMLGWKFTERGRRERAREAEMLATSDVKVFQRTIRVQGDDWMGYMIFKSRILQDELAKAGVGLRYEIEPDFAKRVAHLADGSIDIAAMTIDSWLTNGSKANFPGVIAYVIDESNGGDAVIGGPKVKTLNDLKLPGMRGAFVGYSPSEFLLKSSISHFRLEDVRKNLEKFRVDSIDEAFRRLEKNEVDFAVLWEPQTSQALQRIPGTTRLMDTAQAQGVIIDVAIYGRKFIQGEPKLTTAVTAAYFKALHHYLNRPEELAALAGAFTKTAPETTSRMLAGLTFASLDANQSLWFGNTSATSGKVIEGIQRIVEILVSVGDLERDPFDGNPYIITNRRLLGDLVNNQEIEKLQRVIGPPPRSFGPLDSAQWRKIAQQPVGTLIEEPILFQRGSAEFEEESETLFAQALSKIAHYPRYRIVVEAGVAPGNNPEDDQQLAQERADALRSWMIKNGGLDENRIHAIGLGSDALPPRLVDESAKAWEKRCRYAKILLVAD